MRLTWTNVALSAVISLIGGFGSSDLARAVPWDVIEDSESTAVCGNVNAVNLELVVISDTGELKIISGPDEYLPDTIVDADGFVYFNGFPVGAIEFATDGDDFRTQWWLDFDGTVVAVDESTGEPYTTNFFPTDFHDRLCNACELWDDPVDCDGDLDGVLDWDDACPYTPLNTFVADDGCPCELFDEDGCVTIIVVDLPPDTVVQPPPVTVVPSPPITIVCGSFSTLTMALTFGTLATLRLARRRRS